MICEAVGTDHDGAGLAADLPGLDVARAEAESILLVVADEGLAAGIDDDDAAGFGEDVAAALLALLTRAAEIFHAARSLCRGARRNRRQGLREADCRDRGGDRRRRPTRQRLRRPAAARSVRPSRAPRRGRAGRRRGALGPAGGGPTRLTAAGVAPRRWRTLRLLLWLHGRRAAWRGRRASAAQAAALPPAEAAARDAAAGVAALPAAGLRRWRHGRAGCGGGGGGAAVGRWRRGRRRMGRWRWRCAGGAARVAAPRGAAGAAEGRRAEAEVAAEPRAWRWRRGARGGRCRRAAALPSAAAWAFRRDRSSLAWATTMRRGLRVRWRGLSTASPSEQSWQAARDEVLS